MTEEHKIKRNIKGQLSTQLSQDRIILVVPRVPNNFNGTIQANGTIEILRKNIVLPIGKKDITKY